MFVKSIRVFRKKRKRIYNQIIKGYGHYQYSQTIRQTATDSPRELFAFLHQLFYQKKNVIDYNNTIETPVE